jgi:hypothetical protein
VVFEGLELLEKLAALVSAPKTHLVRYSGILAPAAKWRALIVPTEPAQQPATMHDPACAPETAVTTESLALTAAPANPATVGVRSVCKQFLVMLNVESETRQIPQIHVTLNWFEELKQHVPVR